MADTDYTNGHTLEPSTATTFSDTATVTGSSSFRNGDAATFTVSLVPDIIPERKTQTRTLVLCFDGTGDQFDSDNSNIVELFTMLKKDNRDEQMVYYQAGIGTYTTPQIATPLMAKISKALDEAVAWNLNAHVMDGYEFLMQTYKAGDRICIFGFSRGAYTARALAGMIHKVGLLPACNHQQVPFAYKMFTRVDEIGWQQSNAFKKAFSVDVTIEFVGVWDTVNSVGLFPRRLPFTTSNTSVRTFRHALALDERRAKFKANMWNRPTTGEQQLGIQAKQATPEQVAEPQKQPQKPKKTNTLKAMERKYAVDTGRTSDIEEVWFAGCHCDVGGGSVENGTPNTLARIALRWMIRECFKTDTGILFHAEALRLVGLDPATVYPEVLPRPPPLPVVGVKIQDVPSSLKWHKSKELVNYADADDSVFPKTEEEHELLDAMSPIYDQLSLALFWWVLEVIPIKQRFQQADGTWGSYTAWNLARGRFIPRQKKGKVRIHRSVKMRMEAEHHDGSKYEPKAPLERAKKFGNIIWVD